MPPLKPFKIELALADNSKCKKTLKKGTIHVRICVSSALVTTVQGFKNMYLFFTFIFKQSLTSFLPYWIQEMLYILFYLNDPV